MAASSGRRSPNGVGAPETRDRLLAAAIEAFSEKGFHGTTTRDISQRAGLSPAAVYVHHASKEELLYLIAKRGHEEALQVVRDGVASADKPLQRLRNLMYAFADYHARTHVRSRVTNYELAALSPEHLAEIQVMRRAIFEAFGELVDGGIASGDFAPPDRRMAVTGLISMCVDISRWFRDDGIPAAEVASAYSEMAVRCVGPV